MSSSSARKTANSTTVFLVGMPGCGKSSVGKELAELLHYTFLDLDTLLEEQEEMSIAQIFEQNGQEYFRLAEAKALHKVLGRKEGVVLATGGGAPCFHGNMAFMAEHGVAVYLKVSVGELVARLSAVDLQVRPLLQNKTKEELFQYLGNTLSQREEFYAQAQCVLEVDGQPITAIAEKLNQRVRQFCERFQL